MGAYSYQALDANGKTVKGVVEGDSERHVRSLLRQRQLKPLDVRSVSQKRSKSSDTSSSSPRRLFGGGGPKLSHKDIALVTRQLASLLQSGLPLDEVLQAAATQSRKPTIKSLLLQVRSRVLEGLSLAQAMSEAPKAFNGLYRAMVKAGESAGFLGPVLEQLAEYTETSQETRQKVQTAMMYPVVLLCVSMGVVMALMAFVVPKLTGMFSQTKRELPAITEILIGTSDFIVNYGLFVLIGIIGLIILFKQLLKAPERQLRWHRLLLKMPLFGEFIRVSESARYANTLGLLVKSGVPLLEALRIASQVLTNRVIQDASKAVAVSVQEGTSLHRAMDQVDEFPPLVVQMVASGEANGQLAEQLLHAARNQERELSFTLGTMMGLMEPAMILFMAGIVFFIVMAIMLPIFQMNDMFR
ncbi:type II secretion system protein GspF [Saccharophagus sp. K07]|jgi:general secretion pathway protein F|uniref:type II secretion system inner membrane protein GspF n=1 Tax=Saccharophagus sp. K07 TaxID=2283636 RepID=UPI0016528AE2|nr:type II secretion system inner membrane protein GspF [Saccharophagus sp. K07]MBC6906249.1 type II secretion system protein GspF [Saccharophagus sp. K07]